jgi:hypothetical protein
MLDCAVGSETEQQMSENDIVRRFEYRPCRIPAGFNIDFEVKGHIIFGYCKDVSEEGIRATLDGPATVGASGRLTLRHPSGVLEIEAQVAYIEECHFGLVFVFQTPWERALTTQFIASISVENGTSQIIPFT